MVYYQDEPLGDCVCVPLYFVAKLLKDSGVTVVQVGEGSDELFCGYQQYVRYLNMYSSWSSTQTIIPGFLKKIGYKMLSHLYPQSLNNLDVARNWANNKELFYSGALVFPQLWKEKFLLKTDHKEDPVLRSIYAGFPQSSDSYAVANFHRARGDNFDTYDMMNYMELKHRLPELLLMRADKMTMATSVEARVPFLDHKLVEYALGLEQEFKYRDGQTKYILKKVCENILPHDVIYRKKMGFAAPVTRWFKHGEYFRPMFQQVLNEKRSTWGQLLDFDYIQHLFDENQRNKNVDYGYQLWALLNLIALEYE